MPPFHTIRTRPSKATKPKTGSKGRVAQPNLKIESSVIQVNDVGDFLNLSEKQNENDIDILSLVPNDNPFLIDNNQKFAVLIRPVKNWNTYYKRLIMSFYMNGVANTVSAMNNPELLANVGKTQRRGFWGALYDKTPQLTAKASCVGLNGSVPIEEIFSWNSESHIKWQRYLKTVFFSAADNTYLYRFLTDDEPNSKKKCGKRWVAIPINPNLAQLNLGDVFDIPIKTAGIHDLGKTQEVHISDIGSDEYVAEL
ncbi:hypothetical protein G7Y79_00006g019000 [Physcia stellaris]|nr:hypothetical protein G7Y79_00006g019000 [Physcia stellaris]